MDNVADFVEVEAVSSDCYRPVTESPLDRRTLFGGALVAQALRSAAASTDPEKYPHSLHASFLRAGHAGRSLEFRVARVREGRSFATSQVTAHQGDRLVMTMTASFHRDEPSEEYQRPVHRVVPPTGDGPVRGSLSGGSLGMDIVELSEPTNTPDAIRYLAWARSQQALPVDRVLHACVLAFMSDSGAPRVAASAIGMQAGGPDHKLGDAPMTTSLDHSMWFHRDGRIDDWVLVDAIPLSTAGSRGLVLGTVHDRGGRHLASFTQELLVRPS